MFTELFHTTTLANFTNIKRENRIISRKISKKDANSFILPSHDNLIYFSCNEEHNLKYIQSNNILEENGKSFLEINDIHNLIQIKICIEYEDFKIYNLTMRYDEDSFFKPIIDAILPTENSFYYFENFIESKYKFEDKDLAKKIMKLLPHKQFLLNSNEYKENINALIFPQIDELKCLLEIYYKKIHL